MHCQPSLHEVVFVTNLLAMRWLIIILAYLKVQDNLLGFNVIVIIYPRKLIDL